MAAPAVSGRVKAWVGAGTLAAGVVTAAPVRAEGSPNDVSLLFAALFLPSGLGTGASRTVDQVSWSVLVSWPTQIPLGSPKLFEREQAPEFRVLLEPIVAFSPGSPEFELRLAPRFLVAPWYRTAAFVSVGTTGKFAPFQPSAHVELGLLHGRGEPKGWVGIRADAWFGDVAEQRVAAMMGWAIF